MKHFAYGLALATALSSTAFAGTYQLDLGFSDVDFTFYVDADWMDADATTYDAAATSLELQQHFNSTLPFGGASWNSTERTWEVAPANRPFDAIGLSLLLDIDDFAIGNVNVAPGVVQQGVYGNTLDVTLSLGGASLGSETLAGSYQTLSGNDVALFDSGITADAIGFGAQNGTHRLSFVFSDAFGDTNWFDAVTGGNALEFAVDEGMFGFALSEDEIFSTLGDLLGTVEVFALLNSANLTAVTLESGKIIGGLAPVPVPMTALLLGTGLAALTRLSRKGAAG